jgi:hypothetical protein
MPQSSSTRPDVERPRGKEHGGNVRKEEMSDSQDGQELVVMGKAGWLESQLPGLSSPGRGKAR